MITTSLLLYSEFRLNPDALADLDGSVFQEFVEQTLEEQGCLRCEVFRREDDDAAFVVVSEFEDEAALHAHLDAGFRLEQLERLQSLLAAPPRRFTMHRLA